MMEGVETVALGVLSLVRFDRHRIGTAVLWGPEGGARAGARPRRVMIVEDDYFVMLDYEQTLSDAGFEVVGTASSAERAVPLAAATRPDVIIMDIRLAGERDGIDAAIDILQATGIRCVFASAHADPATRERAAAARPLAWLTKPFDASDLVRAVNRLKQPE